jgi:hypothetical protein
MGTLSTELAARKGFGRARIAVLRKIRACERELKKAEVEQEAA